MPIKSNRYYNNPQIGAAFEGLASLFAPPSAQDTYAYAKAKAESEEAERAAEAFRQMTAEGVSSAEVDRYGVAIGRFNPTQSYRALDMGDATLRRGQDIESGDRRYNTDKSSLASMYGHDRSYQSSVENNVRDNTRAIEDRRMQENGELQRFYAEPVKVSQGERAYLPPQTAAATGLPTQLDGSSAPLTESQQLAKMIAEMPLDRQQGLVSDKYAPTETQAKGRALSTLDNDTLVAMIQGETPLEEAVGPGGRPEFVRRTDAVGRQPAPKTPMVNVNTGEAADGKLRGKLDENEGKRLSDIQSTAVTSSGLRQDLDLLDQLIEQAPQGPIVGRLAGVLPGFSNAGAAFQSIVERAAPGLRVEGSGATSDIEFRGMLNSLPQLRNRPEANRLIAGMMRAKAEINIRRGDLVTAYQNGDIDASQMRRQLADLNRQSIASPALRQMIDAVGGGVEPLSGAEPSSDAPSPGSIVDGHRFRGGEPSDPANWELL